MRDSARRALGAVTWAAMVSLAWAASSCLLSDPANVVDMDGDGFTVALDCDDSDPEVGPRLEDRDQDGFGGNTGLDHCNAPEAPGGDRGFTSQPGDCDDDRPDANPDATEICNELDDDCDGRPDEEAGCVGPPEGTPPPTPPPGGGGSVI